MVWLTVLLFLLKELRKIILSRKNRYINACYIMVSQELANFISHGYRNLVVGDSDYKKPDEGEHSARFNL
jgi:hypothetical protein